MQKVISRYWPERGVTKQWLLTLDCGHTARHKAPEGRYIERKKCKQCEAVQNEK